VVPVLTARGTAAYGSAAEVIARVPKPRLRSTAAPGCPDGHIDVHEPLWSYLRHAVQRGAQRRCAAEVRAIRSAAAARSVVTDAASSARVGSSMPVEHGRV
jgi:hypothetical protein